MNIYEIDQGGLVRRAGEIAMSALSEWIETGGLLRTDRQEALAGWDDATIRMYEYESYTGATLGIWIADEEHSRQDCS